MGVPGGRGVPHSGARGWKTARNGGPPLRCSGMGPQCTRPAILGSARTAPPHQRRELSDPKGVALLGVQRDPPRFRAHTPECQAAEMNRTNTWRTHHHGHITVGTTHACTHNGCHYLRVHSCVIHRPPRNLPAGAKMCH